MDNPVNQMIGRACGDSVDTSTALKEVQALTPTSIRK
jgi:hypothetical protein